MVSLGRSWVARELRRIGPGDLQLALSVLVEQGGAGATRVGHTPSVCSPMRRKNQSPPKPRTNGIRSTAKAVNSLRARNANVASRATS